MCSFTIVLCFFFFSCFTLRTFFQIDERKYMKKREERENNWKEGGLVVFIFLHILNRLEPGITDDDELIARRLELGQTVVDLLRASS